jgi:hypothetical protein
MYRSFIGLLYNLALEVPTYTATRLQLSERPLAGKGGTVIEKLPVILQEMATFTSLQGCFTCRKSATWDRRLYFPSEWRIFSPWKIWRLRPGTRGQHATPGPPKPLPQAAYVRTSYISGVTWGTIKQFNPLQHMKNRIKSLMPNGITGLERVKEMVVMVCFCSCSVSGKHLKPFLIVFQFCLVCFLLLCTLF